MPQPKRAIKKPLVPVPVIPAADEPREAGVDLADLKRKSVRGGAVTIVSQTINISIQLTATVVLARLLSPDDYGIMAMVMVITGFAGLFRDLGLSSAAIQKRDLNHALQSNLFWINVAMGTLLTLLVAAGSPLVAWFYGKPELTSVTLVLSVTFLLGSLGTQHGARLVREMKFVRQATARISGAIVGLTLSIILAFQGFSYWSLVWGNLSGSLTTTILLFFLSPFRPGLPSKGAGIRDMIKFGANVTAFDFVNYFHRNLDNILIGRVIGAAALGHYSRAYSLLMMPINMIRGPINTVGFPALSKLQNNPQEYRIYSSRITATIAFFSMPLVAFMGVSASWIIPLALGPGWEESVEIFSILAVAAFLQPVSSMRGQVMLSMGNSGRYLRWGLVNAILTGLSFCIGIQWGVKGLAIAYAIANSAIFYPSICYAFAGTPVQIRDFLGPLKRPVVFSLTTAAALLVFDHFIEAGNLVSPLIHALVAVVFYGTVYLMLNLLTAGGRDDFKAALTMLRRA